MSSIDTLCVSKDGTQVKCVAPFTLLGQHTCELLPEGGSSVPLDIDDETMTQGESGKRAKQSLQDLVDKQKLPLDISPRTFAKASSNNATAATPATTTSTPRGESGKKKTTMSAKKQQAPPQPVQITTEDGEDEEENTSMMEDVEMAEAAEIEDVAKEEILKTKAFEPEALTEYKGHSAEVFACAWNPSDTMLATGYVLL